MPRRNALFCQLSNWVPIAILGRRKYKHRTRIRFHPEFHQPIHVVNLFLNPREAFLDIAAGNRYPLGLLDECMIASIDWLRDWQSKVPS